MKDLCYKNSLFCQVSLGASKLGNPSIFFIEPGVKMNAEYNREFFAGENAS